MAEPELPTPCCIGGPNCGLRVTTRLASSWTIEFFDYLRTARHVYERRSPTDRNFYHKSTTPLKGAKR